MLPRASTLLPPKGAMYRMQLYREETPLVHQYATAARPRDVIEDNSDAVDQDIHESIESTEPNFAQEHLSTDEENDYSPDGEAQSEGGSPLHQSLIHKIKMLVEQQDDKISMAISPGNQDEFEDSFPLLIPPYLLHQQNHSTDYPALS